MVKITTGVRIIAINTYYEAPTMSTPNILREPIMSIKIRAMMMRAHTSPKNVENSFK